MDDKILRKVRALLAQAESPACTPEEAQAFSEKAEELIARYAIDQALLEHKEHRGKPTKRTFEAQSPYDKPKSTLLAGLCGAYGCTPIRKRSRATSTTEYVVYGFQSDLDAVDALFTSLLIQGSHAMLAAPLSDRSFRSSFWYGFASRVTTRLALQRQKAAREAEDEALVSTALVLAERQTEVDDMVASEHPRLRKGVPGRASSHYGFSSGDAAGARADLGGTRFAGGRAAIGGQS